MKQKSLSEVVVRGKMKDRSEEIIRNVIKHKDDILGAAGPYSCNVYIKSYTGRFNTTKSKN
jgi:hypothetical protein